MRSRTDAFQGPTGKLNSIQSLRALAALFVVVRHIAFLVFGTFGVDIFFVISGFIISMIGSGEGHRFFLKRIFRIVPLYWLGTVAIFSIAYLFPSLLGSTTANIHNLVRSMLFIPYVKESGLAEPMLFLGWSLNFEMMFYVLFAIALLFDSRRAILWTGLAVAGFCLAGLVDRPATEPLRAWTDPIAIEFCYGMVLFLIWKTGALNSVPLWVSGTAAICAVALLIRLDVTHYALGLGPMDIKQSDNLRPLIFGIPSAILVAAVLSMEKKIWFPWVLILIGDASYSLYLSHPYVVGAFNKLMERNKSHLGIEIVLGFMAAGLSILLAIASYRLIEKPSNRLLTLLLKSRMGDGITPTKSGTTL